MESQGNDILNDGFAFRIIDNGFFSTPSNPVFNTVTTDNNIVVALTDAQISVGGTSNLIQGLNPLEH